MTAPVVLSFGGGVNSVAVLTRWLREGRRLDRVIFADTGEEDPRTLRVAEHAAKLCEESGVPFDVVSKGPALVDWYKQQKSIPYITFRSCTDQFKVRPIRRHMRSLGYKSAVMLIGIAWDEVHRVRDSDVQWIRNEYPLVDWKVTRAGCEEEIARHWSGPPVPKSGCMGCPQGGKRLYAGLYQENPEQFQRWRAMEEAGRNYPQDTLIKGGPSLAVLEEAIRSQSTLVAFDDDERGAACGGGCFT